MTIRNEQKEQTRQKILWTALSLFVHRGYTATKITDIAREAQISTGLMFHYFTSKEMLYEELIRIGLKGTHIEERIDVGEPVAYFETFLMELLQYVREQPWVVQMFVLMETTRRSGGVPAHIRELACSVNQVELSAELLRRGQKTGSIRSGDPLALSYAFWSAIQGIMEQLAADQEMPLPDAEWMMAIIKNPEKI